MSGPLKTEAIVLRSMRFGEADRILHLYTPHRGRIGAIAKGVRKTRSRFGVARTGPLVGSPHLTTTFRSNLFESESARNGASTAFCNSMVGRYSSKLRPLMVIWPVPSVIQTRATAVLRRPVAL